MDEVSIRNLTAEGVELKAVYVPGRGMNLISFRKGELEVIDQSTKQAFEERFGGLGQLIGPHFSKRPKRSFPEVENEALFPHIAKMKESANYDPFSHGIGRYAPWTVKAEENKISAVLTGKDTWNGVPLAKLEGQNFKMTYDAEMTPQGLKIEMSVVSDTGSVVGIHHHYRLPDGKGKVSSTVQKKFVQTNEVKPISELISLDSQHRMVFDCEKEGIDCRFYPFPNPLEGKILLETSEYQLETKYGCVCQENSWQLYHPKGASFVCIEPLSAQDPQHPNLTVSSLKIELRIL